MVAFWILAALMTGVALAFVLVPLLRSRARPSPSAVDANLAVLRGQRREIEADIAAGVLPAEAREEALRELVSRTESELAGTRERAGADAGRPVIAAVLVAALLPMATIGVYLATGNFRAVDAPVVAADAGAVAAGAAPKGEAPLSDQQVLAMVENLKKKVQERPDDIQGWSLLARSMNALGRYAEAVEAYEHLEKLVPGNADILVDHADALAMARGRNLQGKPFDLVKQALKINPTHQKGLALAGTATLNAGDFAGSIRYWEQLGKLVAPGSEDEARIREIIAEVRGRAATAGKPLPGPAIASAPAPVPAPAPASPPGPASAPGAAAATVSGAVSLAPALASRVAPTDTLFIFARAEGGPRVPLAVLRGGAGELPKAFVLDDSMAMAPGMKLSTTGAVRIEARVSKSGNALPQPGDLVGSSGVVKPGARDVKIVIDRTLP
jgi:cytochrome c-type biogenesis protein CcmH